MRDDELSRVPKSIEPWRVMEFLRDLGITPEDVYETTIGVRQITVRVWATNAEGRRFLGQDDEVARHEVSVAYDGPWEKPKPVGGEELRPCGHVSPEGGEVCELPEAHYFHRNGGTSWPHREGDQTANKALYEGTWPEPERCDEEGPDGILCEERREHDGEHQARGVFWGVPTR